MSLIADLRRRFDLRFLRSDGSKLAGSPGRVAGASSGSPCERRESHGIPGVGRQAFLAVAEALADGTDAVPASSEVGRRLAEDGVPLPEALDGLRATYCSTIGNEPAYDAVRALSETWSESSLTYLHTLSCEDPLTGLASMAHLRSRLKEIYRESELHGTDVSANHALVMVEAPPASGSSNVDRELRLVDVGECLRIVFCGSEVLGRVGVNRAAALVRREPGLPEQVETVRALIHAWRRDSETAEAFPVPRIWIEGLPASVEWGGRLLDELAR